jgi:hypothetical protein
VSKADEYLLPPGPERDLAYKRAEARVRGALLARRQMRDRSHVVRRWIDVSFIVAIVIVVGVLLWTARTANASVTTDRAKTWFVVSHVFGPYGTATRAFAVTRCETGGRYNRGARNQSSGTAGIFQIHPTWIGRRIYWGRRSILVRDNLHGRWPNARYALFLSKGGRDWSHWAPVCRR